MGRDPVGGVLQEYVGDLPAGPNCLTVWQFDRGYNFALVPTSVMVDGGTARTTAIRPAPRPAFRTPTKAFVI